MKSWPLSALLCSVVACRSSSREGLPRVTPIPVASVTSVAGGVVIDEKMREPIVIARGLGTVSAFAVDDDHAYVANQAGTVEKIPLVGGPGANLAQLPPGDHAVALATAVEGLYVATSRLTVDDDFSLGGILVIPRDGGNPRPLSQGYHGITSVVVDETTLYWVASSRSGLGKSVYSAPRRTGNPVVAKPIELAGYTRVLGARRGAAVLGTTDESPLVEQRFGTSDARGTILAQIMVRFGAAYAGDLFVTPGMFFDPTLDKMMVVLDALRLSSSPPTTLRLLSFDKASERAIGEVAIAEPYVFCVRKGTDAHGRKDGAIQRVSLLDRSSAIVADSQFQPGRLMATKRAVVWVNENGRDPYYDRGDADLVLLPFRR